MTNYHFTLLFLFLSTLSLRRATFLLVKILVKSHDFYPRSPCGERRNGGNHYSYIRISIHALLAESDLETPKQLASISYFYPRSPCGERRDADGVYLVDSIISIHALLAESDMIHPRSCNAKPNFYPRSPCGERRLHSLLV